MKQSNICEPLFPVRPCVRLGKVELLGGVNFAMLLHTSVQTTSRLKIHLQLHVCFWRHLVFVTRINYQKLSGFFYEKNPRFLLNRKHHWLSTEEYISVSHMCSRLWHDSYVKPTSLVLNLSECPPDKYCSSLFGYWEKAAITIIRVTVG